MYRRITRRVKSSTARLLWKWPRVEASNGWLNVVRHNPDDATGFTHQPSKKAHHRREFARALVGVDGQTPQGIEHNDSITTLANLCDKLLLVRRAVQREALAEWIAAKCPGERTVPDP